MPMIRSARERDRLLRYSACGIGLLTDAGALGMALIPGTLQPAAVPFAVTLLLGMMAAHVELARTGRRSRVIAVAVGGVLLVWGLALGLEPGADFAGFVLVNTANAVTASIAVVVTTSPRRLVIVLPVLIPSVIASMVVSSGTMIPAVVFQSLLPWGHAVRLRALDQHGGPAGRAAHRQHRQRTPRRAPGQRD